MNVITSSLIRLTVKDCVVIVIRVIVRRMMKLRGREMGLRREQEMVRKTRDMQVKMLLKIIL